jgi:hypothetical protein
MHTTHYCQRLLAALAALAAPALAPAAQAQVEDYRQIVIAMRACAEISDITARVACYDGSIAPHGQVSASPSPSSASPPVQAAAPVVAAAPATAPSFGSEMLPSTRQAREALEETTLDALVVAVREVQPGIAVLTLGDGAQWRFVDAASYGYDMPRRGETVRLQRGSLGSFHLHFNGQRALRVQRIR